jgi:outer membrane protein
MKNLLLCIALLLSTQAFSEVKVGIVDIQKVITTIKAGKNVMKSLEKSFNQKKKKIEKEDKALRKIGEDLQKKSSLMSKSALQKKDKELRGRIQALQQMKLKANKEIQKLEAELKKPILDKLKPIIDEISKKNDVSFTVERSASPVIYAKSEVDLTAEIIKLYDKKHK